MSLDDVSLHDVQFKVSHNTYELDLYEEAGGAVYSQLYAAHCRGFELDIQQHPTERDEWCVDHDRYSPDKPFADAVARFAEWIRADAGREPIFLLVDVKSKHFDAGFADRLDGVLTANGLTDDILFTPDGFKMGEGDLMQHAMALGWPPIGDLRGKVILWISGKTKAADSYASSVSPERLGFADKEIIAPFSTEEGNSVLANFWLASPAVSPDGWQRLREWYRRRRGLLTRAYEVNSATGFRRAAPLDFNLIACNAKAARDDRIGAPRILRTP